MCYVFQLAHDSTTVQGFTHAMVLVTVCCCPEIIVKAGVRDNLLDTNIRVEEIVECVVKRSLTVNVVSTTNIDKKDRYKNNINACLFDSC